MPIKTAAFLIGLSVPLWFVDAARADLPVAPPPREVRPDGSHEPVPKTARENPVEVIERIVKNSNAVGDKLAKTDTGNESGGKQQKILKDIESLIEQQENPPPMSGGDSNDKKKDQDKNKDSKSAGGKPKGGGSNQQASGRRPRKDGNSGRRKQSGSPSGKKQDSGMAKANPAKGKTPASGVPKGKLDAKRSLPINDSVVKEVWGHLPDKLRQQVSQYYKETFMPKYSELLKRYYSSLANMPQQP